MASGDYSIIFDTGEPAYAVDRYGTITAWNAAASRSLGHAASDAVGRKCWKLLKGQDAFGNQYCCERCPLREMASRHKPVNRCRMYLTTANSELKGFTVSTIVLFDRQDRETLIHMCREIPAAAGDSPSSTRMDHAGDGDCRGVLTPRESQVLKLLCAGHTTSEIGTILSISIPTVRNHIEHILHKLHAHSRLEAVAVGRRLGLV